MEQVTAVDPLNILLWRHWSPLFDFPLTFSAMAQHSIGGTDLQMLLHARYLAAAGHRVQVLGASTIDVAEDRVDFVGARDRSDQERKMRSGRVRPPDVVLMEGSFAAARLFRTFWPSAGIVHVGQNIDPRGHRKAFALRDAVDVFGFVSVGHLADYSVRFPRLRHQFMLLRNVAPWEWIYRHVPAEPACDRVLWVGSWQKKGLRQWASVMARILREFPACTWMLCGPKCDNGQWLLPPEILHGLNLPSERIEVKSLRLAELAREIYRSRVVLVSLGNETASISALDAHALGRPIISGNDVVYKFNNPEGTGLRVTTEDESYRALRHLLGHPELCDRMGKLGHGLVLRQFTERQQGEDLEAILAFLSVKPALRGLAAAPGHSHRYDLLVDARDKALRNFHRLSTLIDRR